MKVTVTKNLNVRVGQASVNAPSYQYLAPGSELEVEEQIYKGDVYDGDDRWLRDQANNYYWVGGTNYDQLKTAQDAPEWEVESPWWITEYKIPEVWQTPNLGEGIEIALLDTGIDVSHPDLKAALSAQSFNALNPGQPILDGQGHGTHMAGIMAGRGEWKVRGVAPAARIIPVKVWETLEINGNTREHYENCLAKALDFVLNQTTARVISMSFSLTGPCKISLGIEQKLNKAIAQGRIVLAAVGNKNTVYSYPARYDALIGVGAVNEQQNIYPSSGGNHKETIKKPVTVLAPGVRVLSSYPIQKSAGGTSVQSGTSQATAWMAGFAALCLSRQKELNQNHFKALLEQTSLAIPGSDPKGQFGNGIVQPQKLLQQL